MSEQSGSPRNEGIPSGNEVKKTLPPMVLREINGPGSPLSPNTSRALRVSRATLRNVGFAAAGAALMGGAAWYMLEKDPEAPRVQTIPGPERTTVVTIAPSPSPTETVSPVQTATPSRSIIVSPSPTTAKNERVSPSPDASPANDPTHEAAASLTPKPSASVEQYPCNPTGGRDLTVCLKFAQTTADAYAYTYPKKDRPHAFALHNGQQIMPECITQNGEWLLGDDEGLEAAGYIDIDVVKGNLGAVAVCN